MLRCSARSFLCHSRSVYSRLSIYGMSELFNWLLPQGLHRHPWRYMCSMHHSTTRELLLWPWWPVRQLPTPAMLWWCMHGWPLSLSVRWRYARNLQGLHELGWGALLQQQRWLYRRLHSDKMRCGRMLDGILLEELRRTHVASFKWLMRTMFGAS